MHRGRHVRAALARGRAPALSAAFSCSGSWHVSTRERVDAALRRAPWPARRTTRFSVCVVGVPERRQLGAGAHRADDEARRAGLRVLLARLARDPRRGQVQRARLLRDVELAQDQRIAAERVRLDGVTAHGQEARVDPAQDVGPRLADDLGAVFEAEVVALQFQVGGVQRGAHGAVEDDDALGQEVAEGARHGVAQAGRIAVATSVMKWGGSRSRAARWRWISANSAACRSSSRPFSVKPRCT